MKVAICLSVILLAAASLLRAAEEPDAAHQVAPEELAKQLQSTHATQLILDVGPRKLYDEAHIRGAEYIGAASTEEGRAKLRERVKSLAKNASIVLYCGCCPWEVCPNVRPAFSELEKMGFTNVKVLHIAQNIGGDWVDQGYPVEAVRR